MKSLRRYSHTKSTAIRSVNSEIKKKMIAGEMITPEEQMMLTQATKAKIGSGLQEFGNQRFFTPDDVSEKTWAETFDGMEWDLDIDITGEARNSLEELTTLNTALQVVLNPAFATNKQAQAIVGRILENTGAMSPVEYASLPSTPAPAPQVEAPPVL
jgi:hypothetical protein